jgi:serralysin
MMCCAGNAGADTLHGGDGNDLLSGGLATDTFIFSGGQDTVQDFQNNLDTLFIDETLFGGLDPEPLNLFDYASVVNGNLIIAIDEVTSLKINGFYNVTAILDDTVFGIV